MGTPPQAMHPFRSSEDWIELFKEAPCGYILTSPDGSILKVNDTLCDWLRFSKEEMEGKMRFQELLPIGDKMFYETRHIVLLKLHEQANELNYHLIDKEGNRKSVLLNSSQRKDKTGKVIAFQFIILPFSDRKKYELELLNAKKKSEEAVEAKSIFLSTITHEIRTPIHAIVNAGNILLKENPSPEQQELLEVINFSSNNLLELINSVLDLTKMEIGKAKVEESSFDICQLLRQLVQVYRPLALEKDVDFELSIPEEVPNLVMGDSAKIRQIFTNLIGNAIKFSQQGTIKLTLTLKEKIENKYIIRFELKDQGIGMSKQELEKIFDPFTQANNSIHQKFGGSGLGLSIVQKLLILLESDLSVDSKLGEGSTFTFDLSLQYAKEIKKKEDTFVVPKQIEDLSNIRILVVDDIFSNILIIKYYFKTWKVPFEYAASGKEAIEKIKKKDFNLILMDLNMPEMDGYETTKCIRSLSEEKYQKLPIIALSAYDASEIKFKVKRSGMDALIQKPFNANQLYQTIINYGKVSERQAIASVLINPVNKEDIMDENFSTKILCDFFDNDCDAIKEYFGVAIKELKVVLKEFIEVESNFSLEAYKFITHKNISLLSMFQLEELRTKMERATHNLLEGNKDQFLSLSQGIRATLLRLSQWMQAKIDQNEDICAK